MIKAKDYILEIDPYRPGKSKAGNNKVIKLSSNENALGSSPEATKAYLEHSKKTFRYSDGGCGDLRKALAEKYKIDADKIVCGAGSDEIIALLTHAFCDIGDEVLYSQYGFLMYPISAKKVGAKSVIAKETDLTANVDNFLAEITNKTKIIFLANPNNPTGSYLKKDEVLRLIKNVPSDILIVLDLAYTEFVDEDDYPNGIELVDQYENVMMIRTFSKIYGLASLRLGWSYSSFYVADVLNRTRGPFNVSGAAQNAGIAAINDDKFLQESKDHNKKWLEILANKFDELKIKHYPSVANFILIDFLSVEKCQKVNQFLLENGVILREMSAYNLPSCLRMTIGQDEENLAAINFLKIFSQ
ncbi:MAG: histidinol-phosphate aminotransferase [Rickettsiales bacterium]|jgi:histidinol-phosphate aminotransferase